MDDTTEQHLALPGLFGTATFPDATDLTDYIAHMTGSAESLASILVSGHLEARKPHGLGYGLYMVERLHLSVSLTENPSTELGRIAAKKGRYGIAFKREFIESAGGQRVWYLSEGSDPLLHLKELMNRAITAKNWDADIWHVTPFVDPLIVGKYEYAHEREIRIAGSSGLRFEWADIAFIVTPQGELLEVNEHPVLSTPVEDHEMAGVYEWWAASLPEIDARMNALDEEFRSAFIDIHLADQYYDREDPDGIADVGFQRYDTCDAIEHIFGEYPVEVRIALQEHLDRTTSGRWFRTAEIDEVSEDAEQEHREEVGASKEAPTHPEL